MAEIEAEKKEQKLFIPPGPLRLPPEEALQGAGEIEKRFGLTDTPRPCLSSMLANGGSADRHKLLHKVGSELRGKHNLATDPLLDFLLEVNSTMTEPEERIGYIHRMVRNFDKKSRVFFYSCQNLELQPFCIGSDDCPYFKGKYRWKNHPISLENFLKEGWLRILRSQETNVWLAVMHLYKIKGLGPSQTLYFTFSEIERVGNVGRKYVRGNLETLVNYKLITDLAIQSVGVSASDAYGRHSSLKLPAVLPHPPLLPLRRPPAGVPNNGTDSSYGGQKAQPNVVKSATLLISEEEDAGPYGGQKAQPLEEKEPSR